MKAQARTRLACALIPLVSGIACFSPRRSSEIGIPVPTTTGVDHAPGELYRLVATGTPDGMAPIANHRLCCQELRAGWLTQRSGNRWVALDTLSVVRVSGAPTYDRSIYPTEPPVTAVDSGRFVPVTRDTVYLISMLHQVVPSGGTVGIRHGDTLTLRSGRNLNGRWRDWETIRVYVRVSRPDGER